MLTASPGRTRGSATRAFGARAESRRSTSTRMGAPSCPTGTKSATRPASLVGPPLAERRCSRLGRKDGVHAHAGQARWPIVCGQQVGNADLVKVVGSDAIAAPVAVLHTGGGQSSQTLLVRFVHQLGSRGARAS